MRIREKFGKYWIAGFIFSIVASATDGLLRLYGDYMASLPAREWWFGPLHFRIPEQSWWIAIIVIVALVSFIFLPWFYGRLVEVLHNKFIIEKKT